MIDNKLAALLDTALSSVGFREASLLGLTAWGDTCG